MQQTQDSHNDLNSDYEQVGKFVLSEAKKVGASDVSVIVSKSVDNLVRFSNNNITLTNKVKTVDVEVYLAKDKRRIIGSTSNIDFDSLSRFIRQLHSSCVALPESEFYVPLPREGLNSPKQNNFDPKLEEDDGLLVNLTRDCISSALESGANRVSGSLTSSVVTESIYTNTGTEASDKSTCILCNVRAFSNSEGSGHGLSCSYSLDNFDPVLAGQTAGAYAKQSDNPKQLEQGRYDVIFSPTVSADLVEHVGEFASAFTVLTGGSFLENLLGKQVAVPDFSLVDEGIGDETFGGRSFDDEGVSTQKTTIIKNGIAETYLHNSTTANVFKTSTTGSAGIIDPHPWNLSVEPGDSSFEEMVKETKRGVVITNNWYTRFQNYRAGEYSTVPRDAAFYIENGEIKNAVAELRVSDSIPRQLQNIFLLSKERRWVKWWEVNIPTFSPWIAVREVPITRAVK
jgi:PmbA protein